jgi:hypothetical protein
LAVHRDNGPVILDSNFATVITLSNVLPGNYVATAKTNLAKAAGTVISFTFCELRVTPAGGPITVRDTWIEEEFPTANQQAWVVNMQRPLNLTPAAPFYTVQVACEVFSVGQLQWSATNSSIILIQADNVTENEVNQ